MALAHRRNVLFIFQEGITGIAAKTRDAGNMLTCTGRYASSSLKYNEWFVGSKNGVDMQGVREFMTFAS